ALGRVGVMEDLAVDRHRHALVDLMAEPRKAALELGDQAAHRVRLDVELGLPAGEAAGRRPGDHDVRHGFRLSLRAQRSNLGSNLAQWEPPPREIASSLRSSQ